MIRFASALTHLGKSQAFALILKSYLYFNGLHSRASHFLVKKGRFHEMKMVNFLLFQQKRFIFTLIIKNIITGVLLT